MLSLLPERLDSVVLIGAHCDDIVVGCGGTLLELCRAYQGVEVSALVLTGAGSLREAEERDALAAFSPGARLRIGVLDLPPSELPARWDRVKRSLEELRSRCDPGLVFGPAPRDGHHDRRLVADLLPVVFPDHLVLGYEILQRDGELAQPSVYCPLAEPVLREKIEKMREYYGSQRDRASFDAEHVTGLAKLRGLQCRARYAEAFHVARLVLAMASLSGGDPF